MGIICTFFDTNLHMYIVWGMSCILVSITHEQAKIKNKKIRYFLMSYVQKTFCQTLTGKCTVLKGLGLLEVWNEGSKRLCFVSEVLTLSCDVLFDSLCGVPTVFIMHADQPLLTWAKSFILCGMWTQLSGETTLQSPAGVKGHCIGDAHQSVTFIAKLPFQISVKSFHAGSKRINKTSKWVTHSLSASELHLLVYLSICIL